MSRSLAVTPAAYALGLAGWIVARAARGRDRSEPQGAALAVLQCALALQALLCAIAWARGVRPEEPLAFAGYLALSLLLAPAGWLACARDRSAWSTLRLAVVALALAAVALRMTTTWSAGGA
jgi:hypothetical protein